MARVIVTAHTGHRSLGHDQVKECHCKMPCTSHVGVLMRACPCFFPDTFSEDSLLQEMVFLHTISLNEDRKPTLSSSMQVLDEGVQVTGVVLLSAGPLCVIDQIRANVSIVPPLIGRQSIKRTLISLSFCPSLRC